ncbi:hypothetical protein LTR17_020960 [Elasticomyces elasticus]|nr:hypothetical protein LTR17_020960 [Elasticomyces elasticus]
MTPVQFLLAITTAVYSILILTLGLTSTNTLPAITSVALAYAEYCEVIVEFSNQLGASADDLYIRRLTSPDLHVTDLAVQLRTAHNSGNMSEEQALLEANSMHVLVIALRFAHGTVLEQLAIENGKGMAIMNTRGCWVKRVVQCFLIHRKILALESAGPSFVKLALKADRMVRNVYPSRFEAIGAMEGFAVLHAMSSI